MKQATLLIVFLATGSFLFANTGNRYSLTIPATDSSLIEISSMQEMLQQIMNIMGTNEGYELKEGDVLNIETTMSHKKRYIIYNPGFISNLRMLTKSKWSVMALLAHEVGHHVKGHTDGNSGSQPDLELEADEFAGFVLYKLGATLKESQNVMYYISKTEASKTHPARSSRLLAIENGWKKAEQAAQATASSKKM